MTNPKIGLYYATVLPNFLTAEINQGAYIIAMGAAHNVLGFMLFAFFLIKGTSLFGNQRTKANITVLTGVALITFCGLALSFVYADLSSMWRSPSWQTYHGITTTLLIGSFFLGFSLGLEKTMVGLVMSVGPCISIASGVPSGRIVDRLGARPVLLVGLILMVAGAFSLTVFPMLIGLTGYIFAIAVLTPGYQIFLAANNTLVMVSASKNQRGTTSGLLQLSRNIGLIAGASIMGVIFTFGVGTKVVEDASSSAINNGIRLTFFVAGLLALVAFYTSLRPVK